MPNDILDPEKDEAREPYATSSNDGSSDQGSISSRLPPLEVTSSKRSRSSHGRPPTGDGPGDRPAVEPDAGGQLAPVRTAMSVGSAGARPPEFEVVFEDDDAENPRNFSLKYKAWVIFSVSYSTWVIVLYSTSYTASIPGLMKEFNVSSTPVATLGLTTYLLGLAAGSLVVAPLSELYGRRPVYLICLTIATLLVLPCCLATSLAEIVVVRFFGAVFGAAMVANSPGTIADISDDEYRALCMSLWSIAPLNGPVTGPLIGGFVYQYMGWRWDNWLVMILSGVSVLIMAGVSETYAPAILKQKAARLRKETGDERWWCRYEERVSTWQLTKMNLMRPFILSLTEPILWFFNIWISLIYGILYLCFVAYPIVFVQYRGWGPGISGLAFVGIGVGTVLAIACEPLIRRLINSYPKEPETGKSLPEAMGSIMTIGAVLTCVGQLVFSWTSLPVTIHWAVPIAMGVPFGAGNTLSFIYGANYITGAYGVYAASAMAGNAVMRSFVGGTLPLVGPAMYAALTPQWAGTLLGLLEVCLIPIPIVFHRYGAKIRARSPVIRQMREDQARNERRKTTTLSKAQQKVETENVRGPVGTEDAEKALHAQPRDNTSHRSTPISKEEAGP